jgi:hypothetical protein
MNRPQKALFGKDAPTAATKNEELPAFLEDDGTIYDIPDRVMTTTAREQFNLRAYETLIEAIYERLKKDNPEPYITFLNHFYYQ